METTIFQHTIKYNFFDVDDLEMDEVDREYVTLQIEKGFSSGELCQVTNIETGETSRGWWEIKK